MEIKLWLIIQDVSRLLHGCITQYHYELRKTRSKLMQSIAFSIYKYLESFIVI